MNCGPLSLQLSRICIIMGASTGRGERGSLYRSLGLHPLKAPTRLLNGRKWHLAHR